MSLQMNYRLVGTVVDDTGDGDGGRRLEGVELGPHLGRRHRSWLGW